MILAIDASHHQFLPLDRNVREWVQPIRSGGLDLSMETVSLLGAPAGLVPLILIASAVLWRASRRWALLLPILMAGTGALQLAGKWAADRPRPNAAPWGFPSGHVLSLVVFFGVTAFLLITLSERRRRVRVLACFSCGAVVGLVAVSRIYLDMHWLSDVIGGFTLGSAYLLIALWASQLIFAARPAVAVAKPAEAIPPADNAGVGSGVVIEVMMIRKLAAGGYRLYSRKKDPKTGSVAISGPSPHARRQRSTSARCSISSGTDRRSRGGDVATAAVTGLPGSFRLTPENGGKGP